MRRGERISFEEVAGISQEQPEQAAMVPTPTPCGFWNWRDLTSTWTPPALAGNCGSLAEPLEYIVFIWAHHPIGGINKEGIPLSLLPQQRRKGEEQSRWEEKWSKGRGGEGRGGEGAHREGRGGHCLSVTVGNGKAGVIGACVSVFRQRFWMWACVSEKAWLSMLWRGNVGLCVHVCVDVRGVWDVGKPFKGCSNKAGAPLPSLLSILNSDWGLAGFLYSCCLAQLGFRVSVTHVSFKPPKPPGT